MKMTRDELRALLKKNPQLTIEEGAVNEQGTRHPIKNKGIHSGKQEPDKGGALDCSAKRKNQSTQRFEILFTVFAIRPNDWDNPWVKTLQDGLVRSGILHSDDWRTLKGGVDPQKAINGEEETVIEIYRI